MSTQSALQPFLSIATTYKVPDQDPTSNPPVQYSIALQPNISAPGVQTLVPGPAPSH